MASPAAFETGARAQSQHAGGGSLDGGGDDYAALTHGARVLDKKQQLLRESLADVEHLARQALRPLLETIDAQRATMLYTHSTDHGSPAALACSDLVPLMTLPAAVASGSVAPAAGAGAGFAMDIDGESRGGDGGDGAEFVPSASRFRLRETPAERALRQGTAALQETDDGVRQLARNLIERGRRLHDGQPAGISIEQFLELRLLVKKLQRHHATLRQALDDARRLVDATLAPLLAVADVQRASGLVAPAVEQRNTPTGRLCGDLVPLVAPPVVVGRRAHRNAAPRGVGGGLPGHRDPRRARGSSSAAAAWPSERLPL